MTTRPINRKCKPCVVRYNSRLYYIAKDGVVRETSKNEDGTIDRTGAVLPESEAAIIRHEAARLRRNRAARERSQVMRDLGLRRTSYGWE